MYMKLAVELDLDPVEFSEQHSKMILLVRDERLDEGERAQLLGVLGIMDMIADAMHEGIKDDLLRAIDTIESRTMNAPFARNIDKCISYLRANVDDIVDTTKR